MEAIRVAETLPAVQTGSFELRAIGIPALHVQALWLRDTVGENHLVIPTSGPRPLALGQPVGPVDFFAPPQELARQMLDITERVQA